MNLRDLLPLEVEDNCRRELAALRGESGVNQ
jgi:hypothetical protein